MNCLSKWLLRIVLVVGCVSLVVTSCWAGRVEFLVKLKPGSQWVLNSRALAAVESMLGQFEAVMRTSGPWDSTIEVLLTDEESTAFASAGPGSSGIALYQGKRVRVPNSWQQMVLGVDDPNGRIRPGGKNSDIIINWNFALSRPEINVGLLRHEMMHGLGMTSLLPEPSMAIGGAITRPGIGREHTASAYDTALYDLQGDPLLAGVNGAGAHRHVLADYAVDSDWGDANESGIVFRGIDDEGASVDMIVNSRQASETRTGQVDFDHLSEVSYRLPHPREQWGVVNAADRAFFRGLGYQAVSPTTRLADYDHNTNINGGDFLAWQRTLGSTVELSADGNSNGIVDEADLLIWENDFGSSDDHNHTARKASSVPGSGAEGGVISSPEDVDWFTFVGSSLRSYQILPYGGTLANPRLELFDADRVTPIPITEEWRPPVSARYFLRVSSPNETEFGS